MAGLGSDPDDHQVGVEGSVGQHDAGHGGGYSQSLRSCPPVLFPESLRPCPPVLFPEESLRSCPPAPSPRTSSHPDAGADVHALRGAAGDQFTDPLARTAASGPVAARPARRRPRACVMATSQPMKPCRSPRRAGWWRSAPQLYIASSLTAAPGCRQVGNDGIVWAQAPVAINRSSGVEHGAVGQRWVRAAGSSDWAEHRV